MDSWLLYLIIAGAVGFFVLWTGFLKHWAKMAMVITAIVIVVIAAAPSTAIYLVDRSDKNADKAEARELVEKFNERYKDDEYNIIVNANKVAAYLITRAKTNEDGKVDLSLGVEQSLLIGNNWLEINSTNDEEETETEE